MMLVSKLPLENKQYLNFDDAFIAQQGMLYGEADGVGIACTHLSSLWPNYAGLHGSS